MKRWPIYLNIIVISLFLVAQLGTSDAYPLVPRNSDDDTGSVIYNPVKDDGDSDNLSDDSDYTRKGGSFGDSDSDSDDDLPTGDDVTVIYNPRPEDLEPKRPTDTSAKEDNKKGAASDSKDGALKQTSDKNEKMAGDGNVSPITDNGKASENKADKGDDTASNNNMDDVNDSSDSLTGTNKDNDSVTKGKDSNADDSKKKGKIVSFNDDVDVITTGNDEDGAAEEKSGSVKGDGNDLDSAPQGKGKESEKITDKKTAIDDAPTKVVSDSGTSGNQDSPPEGKTKENEKSADDETTADNTPAIATIDPNGINKGKGKEEGSGNGTTVDNGEKRPVDDKDGTSDQGNAASNSASDGKDNGKSPNDDAKGKGGVSDQGGATHDASGGKGVGKPPEDEPKGEATDAGKKDDASGAEKPEDLVEQGAKFMTVDSFRFDSETKTGEINHKLKVTLLTGGARLGKPDTDDISRKFFVVSADSHRRTVGILKIVNLKKAAGLHGQDAVDALIQEGAFWKEIGAKKLMWQKKIKDKKTQNLVEYRILYRAMYGMVENGKDDKNPQTLNLKFMHEWAAGEDWDGKTMLPKCQNVAYQKHRRLALDHSLELSKFSLSSWVTDKECDHWFPYEAPPSYVFRDSKLSRVTILGAKWMSPDVSKKQAYLKDLKTKKEFTKHFTDAEVKRAQQDFEELQRGVVAV